tara:strand:- start:13066 stop:14499 length:1434 start_codon:yes stop_codon:yes gene_type:complete
MIELVHTLALKGETWSTPAIVRTGNTAIIVAADRAGYLSAFSGDGSLLWQRQIALEITSSPVVETLDGRPTIIIGTHADQLHLIDPSSGNDIATFPTEDMVRAVPATADINNDGKPEIIIAAYGPAIFAVDGTGRQLWKTNLPKHMFISGTKRGIVSSPLVFDVDCDGRLEIVFGTRSSRFFCLDALSGEVKWFTKLRYDCDSPPSFAMSEGKPLILIGGGEHTGGAGDNALIALDGRNGQTVWRAETNGGIDGAATIVKLPGGREVAYACTLASALCIAIDLHSGSRYWTHKFGPTPQCDHNHNNQCQVSTDQNYFTEYARCRSYSTPLLADLHNDGQMKVIVGSNNGKLVILDAETGEIDYEENVDQMVRGSMILAKLGSNDENHLIVPAGDTLRLYRTDFLGVAWSQFKGRPDHLGNLSDQPIFPIAPQSIDTLRIRASMFYHFVILDSVRWFTCQLDKFIFRKFGFTVFEYYY